MKNRYDGVCVFCSCKVPKKDGICFENKEKGWVISCFKCANVGVNLNKRLDKLR